ncbi:SRPBCC family protein [Klebsiella pneumoniae]
MVFVNISGDAPTFEEHIAPLVERWKPFLGENGLELIRSSKVGSTFELPVKSNWKLTVENYCEAYHLPWVHPADSGTSVCSPQVIGEAGGRSQYQS